MTSTAISAQGSTIQIATGSGSAKTITAIQLGNPTIVTIAAHGFAEGDVNTLAGFTGTDAATLNGATVSVRNKTTNTFAVYIDTTGKTITIGTATAMPVTFTNIVNFRTFNGFDGSASEIDVTNMASTAKEFILGLTDSGQFTFEVDYATTDAGHSALIAKKASGVLTGFKLTLPDATAVTFNAFVKKFSATGGVDAVVRRSVDLRISGAVTGI